MNKKGFTIIELLIATSIFSVILLICATGIIYVGRLYHKGATSTAVQEVARSSIDEIKNDFQYGGGFFAKLINNGPNEGFCIGDNLYSYQVSPHKINADGSGHALVVRNRPNCYTDAIASPPSVQPDNINDGQTAPAGFPWRELLGPNMRIKSDIFPTSPTAGAPSIKFVISIISADDDLIDASGNCNSGFGSQFCATAELSSDAYRRIRVK